MNESEFVRHLPCENCGSSDANALYSDDHTHCFRCGAHSSGTGDVVHNHKMEDVQLQGEAVSLPARGLSQKTAEKFKTYRDGELLRHYYYDSSGTLVGAKVRTKDKQFRIEGTVKTLFGMQLFRHVTSSNGDKKLVITEGELDAMSCWEAQPNWPVVSVPNGAQAAKKAIQHNYEWIDYYDKIVLFFDNDPAGAQAAQECAAVLPPGKVFIGTLDKYKDASEALQAGDSNAVRGVMNYDHKQYKPDGIVDAKNLLVEVTTPTPPADHDYPFQGLQNKLHGIRYGELVTITSGSGVGKSSVCRFLAAHLLQKGERVGYVALEESNKRTALGLMSVATGKAWHIGEHKQKDLVKAFDETLKNWNLFLFDGFGSYDPDVIYKRIEYLACGLDTKIIFLDHLSILLSGLDGDERRMIDTTMTKLRSLVERTGVAMFLVSHLRRTSNDKPHEEGARVTMGQLRGSAAIAQLSDTVIALERDQQAPSGGSDTTVRVLKNRYSGEVGVACNLTYDLSTCKFNETEPEEEFDPQQDF